MSDEEIDLQTMSDDEIYELMKEDLYDGYAEEVVEDCLLYTSDAADE